ncbi:hypothetical protein D3C83_77990 [compost metagenome]
MRLDGILAPIQRNHGAQVAAGDAEVERLEPQDGIAQAQVDHEVFQRQFLRAADSCRLEADFGVDAVPAIRLERHVGQHACRKR